MISEQEKKQIRRYCLLPSIAAACLAVAILIGIPWIVLVMINDIVWEGGFYGLGLYTYLGIAAVSLTAFVVCFLIPRIGMRKEKWMRIVEQANVMLSNNDYSAQLAASMGARAMGTLLRHTNRENASAMGDAFNALAAVGTLATVTQMTNELRRNAKCIAAIYGVKVPKARNYVLAVILIPVLLLIGVYIPQFVSAKQNADAGIVQASKSVYALQDSFKTDCDHVSIDDPKEGYNGSGYDVTGYLYAYDEPYQSYIWVTVGNDGQICEVIYCIDVDVHASKEETLEKASLDLLKLNVMMNDSNVKAVSEQMLSEYTLPEMFVEQFADHSYYENLRVSVDESYSVSYVTEPEEEYDESSEPYIYITLEA